MLTVFFLPIPGARVIYSTRLHSRIIDRIRVSSALCAGLWWKVREAFPAAKEQEVAPDAPCLAAHPVSFGRILRDWAGAGFFNKLPVTLE